MQPSRTENLGVARIIEHPVPDPGRGIKSYFPTCGVYIL